MLAYCNNKCWSQSFLLSFRSVMLDRAENLLHDHYGGKDYWDVSTGRNHIWFIISVYIGLKGLVHPDLLFSYNLRDSGRKTGFILPIYRCYKGASLCLFNIAEQEMRLDKRQNLTEKISSVCTFFFVQVKEKNRLPTAALTCTQL